MLFMLTLGASLAARFPCRPRARTWERLAQSVLKTASSISALQRGGLAGTGWPESASLARSASIMSRSQPDESGSRQYSSISSSVYLRWAALALCGKNCERRSEGRARVGRRWRGVRAREAGEGGTDLRLHRRHELVEVESPHGHAVGARVQAGETTHRGRRCVERLRGRKEADSELERHDEGKGRTKLLVIALGLAAAHTAFW